MKGFKSTGNGPKAGHSFGASHGFSGSAGKSTVKSHTRAAPKRNPAPSQGALQALAGLAAAAQGGGGPPSMGGGSPPMIGSPQVPGAPMGGGSEVPGAGPPGMKKGGKWIAGAIKHPGALHRALHVPMGEKIPAAKMAKAAHSSNPTMRKRANLAKTLGGFSKHAEGGRAGHGADCGCAMCSGGSVGYAKGGAVGNFNGENIKQDAPHGRPEFQDFRKGGRARKVKESGGGIIIMRPR